jgi:2-hydroxy-6-oxonona-2,4-dienedioate hydrolase
MFSSFWTDLRGAGFCQNFVDAGGIRTRYLSAGADNQPPLIFLHGTGGHAEAFVRNLADHGKVFRTFAIDMVGHGWTDKPDRLMDIAAYVDHLARFLDAVRIDRAHISGESLGGWVAARFALTHPDRLDRLVLNTTGGSTAHPQVMAKIIELSTRAATNPTWEFIKARLEWLMADPASVTDDLVAARQAIYSAPGFSEAMRRILVLQDMEVRKRNLIADAEWRQIKSKTLVLWTTHDPTNPVAEGARIAAMIPQSSFVVMKNCGHWPQFEDAPTFNAIHIDFLLGRDIAQHLYGA